MDTLRIIILAAFFGLISFATLHAQQPAGQNSGISWATGQAPPHRNSRRPRAASIRERLLKQIPGTSSSPRDLAESAAPALCNGTTGTRFNLEPRTNATLQAAATADFILTGVGMDQDLIVQMAGDDRGLDSSGSGYYVHRSTTADCSVQFEGGLPPFKFQGDTFVGTNAQGGGPLVVADNTRRVFFAADGRTGANSAGIGLFRATAANLLDPAKCPNGTHTLAQAKSCWMQTAPVFLDPLPPADEAGEPFLAVDERKTGSGTGAGDVYVLYGNGQPPLSIVACTNHLNCGAPAPIPVPANTIDLPYGGVDVHVLPGGVITISFGLLPSDRRQSGETIFFTTCTPAGAPRPPTCSQPTTVTNVQNNLLAPFSGNPLQNIGFPLEITFPRHATRPGPGQDFTTFIVYDDCFAPFKDSFGNQLCAGGEVNLTISTDSGTTWSTPLSVDRKVGHHFFGNVTADASTGTVSIVYLSTEGDPNFHETRVMLNQIAPGSIKLGPPQRLTSVFTAGDTGALGNFFLGDLGFGAISRGTGTAGHSRLYTSFNSSAVSGLYEKKPLPDLNNHISMMIF